MPKSKAAKLAKRVLRAAGAGNLAELQQVVATSGGGGAAAAADGAADSQSDSLARSPLLECADADECQPLHRAAAAGHTHVVMYLLEQGVDPNCRKSKAKTPLHEAAAGGHSAVIEGLLAKLLGHGANLRDRNRDGQTALYLACREGHRALAELLLDPATTTNAPHTGHNAGRMPAAALQWQVMLATETAPVDVPAAAAGGSSEPKNADSAAAERADRGPEPLLAMRTRNMKTALHGAAINGHVEVVRLLLQPSQAKHGSQGSVVAADPQATDLCGSTALIDAAANGQKAVVDELLKFAAVAAKQPRVVGGSPLTSIEKGAEPDPATQNQLAQWVHQRDLNGRNALHCAVVGEATADVDEETRLSIVCQLLDYGLHVDSKDEDGSTPLYWSCAQGLSQVAGQLLARGADANCRSARRHAIHVAIGWKRPQCLRLLIEHGADITACDMDGKDALALVESDDACEDCREMVLQASVATTA